MHDEIRIDDCTRWERGVLLVILLLTAVVIGAAAYVMTAPF